MFPASDVLTICNLHLAVRSQLGPFKGDFRQSLLISLCYLSHKRCTNSVCKTACNKKIREKSAKSIYHSYLKQK